MAAGRSDTIRGRSAGSEAGEPQATNPWLPIPQARRKVRHKAGGYPRANRGDRGTRGGRDRARVRRLRRRQRTQVQPPLPEREPTRARQPGPDRRPAGRLGRKHRTDRRQPRQGRRQRRTGTAEGTTATIRATSLSGVANHYVSVSPGPNSNPALDEGATLGLASTTTPIDIDQFFNTFPPPVRRGLGNFIKGNAEIYAGRGPDGNKTFKYLGVGFNRVGALVHALNSDEHLFSRFLVSSSRLATTVSERGTELSSAIANANNAFGAIASQNVALGRSLRCCRRLPPGQHHLRQPPRRARRPRTADRHHEDGDQGTRPLPQRIPPGYLASGAGLQEPPPHRQPAGLRQRRRRTARHPADRAAAGVEGVPPRRRRDRRLPAQPQLLPRLHAGPLQRLRQAGPDHGPYDANGHYARVSFSDLNIFKSARQRPLEPIAPSEQYDASVPRPGSSGVAPAAPASPPPTAPAPSSNRPLPAPA